MDNIQKFFSDVEKLKKNYRSSNKNYNGQQVCEKIKDLFINENRNVESLASSFADYWFNTYILNSSDIQNEPSEKSMDVLESMLNLLQNNPENCQHLTDKDWKELCNLTKYEAEDLDIDLLNDLMMIILDKKAF